MGLELDKDQREELRRMAIESDIKVSVVDRIIEMTSPESPKRQFSIDTPKLGRDSNKLYLHAAATGLVTDAVVYFIRRKTTGDNGSLEIVIGIICLVFCVVAVFWDSLNDNTARVIGEELKIGQKSYFTCDIECIKCQNSEVKVISGGKPILKLTKSHEGCDELIKWARFYEIPVDNTYTLPTLKVRFLGTFIVFAFLALFAGAMILLMIKC